MPPQNVHLVFSVRRNLEMALELTLLLVGLHFLSLLRVKSAEENNVVRLLSLFGFTGGRVYDVVVTSLACNIFQFRLCSRPPFIAPHCALYLDVPLLLLLSLI